ncbi:right-handed parallel beta-helix repeat-containing protein [Adhaeretor mobilis]|uniref:right-handed parallel beta-helix repeat-containing protein n=1 Tax=Adhaeretor mobilis TaxID=1930276 RepID=UPI001C54F802|nr:right-handed parallel beta-helix repeat-containing protein [Adhaeretor mobilis]
MLILFVGACSWLLASSAAPAATYYVANNGNDFRSFSQAQNPDTPWKTLDKINGLNLNPGDNVLFNRGDTWRESLVASNSGVTGSPITYGAYGLGANPTISASSVISDWTPHQGNIYVANTPAPVNQLFFNDAPLTLARTPNEGYLKMDYKTDATTFVDAALGTDIDWTGATAHIRTLQWNIATEPVAAFNPSNKAVTLASEPTYGLPDQSGWGYFLNNKLEALDSPGEWYYDAPTQQTYVWMPDGDSPANYLIEGSALDYGVELSANTHDIKISDLTIKHAAKHGIFADRSSDISVENNEILYPDAVAVFVGTEFSRQGSDSLIDGNLIVGANHAAIYSSNDATTITNNTVRDTGEFQRINASGIGSNIYGAIGTKLRGNDNVVSNNHFSDTGYSTITFSGENTLIEQNLIENSNKIKDDGAAIYTYNPNGALPGSAGSIIRFNIILDTQGAPEGTANENFRSTSAGIYLDENTHDVLVANNTVSNSYERGIFVHRSFDNQVIDNTLYDNEGGQLRFSEGNNIPVSGHTATGNIFFSLTPEQIGLSLSSQLSNPDFGTFDDNYFGNPYSEDVVEHKAGSAGNATFTLAEWQAFSSQDSNSATNNFSFDPEDGDPHGLAMLFINPTTTDSVIDLAGLTYLDLQGNTVSGSITLSPFASQILIFDATGGLAGDFTGDGNVDGIDFLDWQANPTIGNLADWQQNYGMSTSSSASTSTAVPEPISAVLLALTGLFALRQRSARSERS